MSNYGCDKVIIQAERFDCSLPCGYKMGDGKCGRLSTDEARVTPNPVQHKKVARGCLKSQNRGNVERSSQMKGEANEQRGA